MTIEQPRTKRGLVTCLVMGCALLGCRTGQPRVASDLEPEIPASLFADYTSFRENCNKCHALERALTAHVDDVRHWDLYVAKMMRTAGSAISAAEGPKILRFLYWYTERKERLAMEGKRAKQNVGKEPRGSKAEAAPPEAPVPPPVSPAAAPSTVTADASVQHQQGESAP